MPDADAGTIPLANQRSAFAVPDDVAYFNTASLSPMLHRALDAGHEALRRRAAPWTIDTPDWFSGVERLRGLVAGLFGGDAEGVALVPASSYGLATVARNLPIRPGETIVVPQEEYPSAVYTWRTCARDTGARIVTVRRAAGQGWADAVVAAVDRGTAVVSVPQVHWTDGALVDLDAVADRCRQVGAHLVIDASQSLGAMPLDVTTLKPDAVVSVGYKWLLGPVGRAYLWLAEQHRDGRPLEENWIARAGADDFAALVDYRDDYQPGARRFDQGARTLLELTPVAIAALEQIHEWGVERIAAALRRVTADITDRLGAQGLVPSAPANGRGPHLLGVPVPPEARDGLLPALERAGCHAGLRGTSLRIAPHLHVTPDDVDRLVAAVAAALHGGS